MKKSSGQSTLCLNSCSTASPEKHTELIDHELAVVEFLLGFQEFPNLSRDSLWKMIDVLRLDDGLQVIFQDLGKVVLQL